MCLCIEKGLSGVRILPRTAIEPIKVYKILSLEKTIFGTKKWVSPVRGTPVKFLFGKSKLGDGTMNGSLMSKWLYQHIEWKDGKISSAYIIGENDKIALPLEKIDPMPSSGVVEKGIHAIVSANDARYAKAFEGLTRNKMFEAVIPKGAHYYIGDMGDIVADRMVVYKNGINDKNIKTLEDVIK
jgi:hypothetical protein